MSTGVKWRTAVIHTDRAATKLIWLALKTYHGRLGAGQQRLKESYEPIRNPLRGALHQQIQLR